jgi:hypothetical protein
MGTGWLILKPHLRGNDSRPKNSEKLDVPSGPFKRSGIIASLASPPSLETLCLETLCLERLCMERLCMERLAARGRKGHARKRGRERAVQSAAKRWPLKPLGLRSQVL